MLKSILNIDGDEGQSIPLIIDSPHSGIIYPEDFNHQADLVFLRQAEDTYVDELYEHISYIGGVILRANFPRSYIDPNRSETDFSIEDILDEDINRSEYTFEPSIKSNLGIGLVWTKIPPNGMPMYSKKITYTELLMRINNYHRPYHQNLLKIMNKTYNKFGRFYHINVHSMQDQATAMSTQEQGTKRPDFVIGDRDGSSCNIKFRNIIVEYLKDLNYSVSINDPYKGFELVSAYSNPLINKHSIQIEVNRKLYMNEETRIKNDGFDMLKQNLKSLLETLKSSLKY